MSIDYVDKLSMQCQAAKKINEIEVASSSNYDTVGLAPKMTRSALALLIFGAIICSLANPSLLLNYCIANQMASKDIESLPLTKPFRALYVVASMAEYQTGAKGTVKGEDRFANTFVPIISNAAHSIANHYPHWDLDVFLIIGYNLRPERYEYLRSKLPEGVGLQLWENAIPLSYNSSTDERLVQNLQSVNRQHRFVLRDKLNYYDIFIVGEDDMAINAAHVEQYLDIQTEIDRLREEALKREQLNKKSGRYDKNLFYGNLSSAQLSQMIPGFIRVEVLPADFQHDRPYKSFTSEDEEFQLDASPCCQLSQGENPSDPLHRLPLHPKPSQLLIWETAIEALGVRKFPPSSHLGWVAYLPGAVDNKIKATTDFYWSGQSGILGMNPVRPSPHNLSLFSHQAMYILSRDQILALDKNDTCKGLFLPPFRRDIRRNGIHWHSDGKFMNSAEFMVGGLQLYTQGAKNAEKAGCNLQRIVSLANFSKHLAYHISNNKQRTINPARHVIAEELLQQLSFVKRKAAESLPIE
jgi:hypothetical protein